ncbi:D-isomer specific 2-hydroxyacid dehydrogenase [Fennellomyces sp. T-0311]|nr:D-isomer specific 2-hydroxyacid dehydrogenase [Fennellomyces sp. T-0311]
MPRGLIVGPLISVRLDAFETFMKSHDIEVISSKTRQDLFVDFAEKYKDVKAIYLSAFGVGTYGPFDKEFVNHLPEKLKYINYSLAGYDALDIAACTARNIYVSHVEKMIDAPTADMAAYLILASFRNTTHAQNNLRLGRWNRGVALGNDPEGKMLGILGMGGIGKALAKRMRGFEMSIQYNNRNRLSAEVEKEYGATYVSFEVLLQTSDVIFVSVPLSPSTFHLLDTPQFAMMKPGVIIVNTARGKVISESALVTALESGHVAAAGLDVFEDEPNVHPGLLTHPRCTLQPHISSSTKESLYNMDTATMKNMEAALDHDTLLTPVPEHKHFFGA